MLKTNISAKVRKSALLLLAFFVVNGCEDISPWILDLTDNHTTTLRVAALRGTLVQIRQNEGLEYDLIERFGKDNNIRIKWSWYDDEEELASALNSDQADLAAGRLRADRAREYHLTNGPTYEDSSYRLACNSSAKNLRQTTLILPKHTANNKIVEKLSKWTPTKNILIAPQDSFDLLQSVQKAKTPRCALMENTEANFYLRFLPKLKLREDVAVKISIGFWMNPKREDLRSQFVSWFRASRRNGFITQVRHQYQDHKSSLGSDDLERFFQVSKQRQRSLAPVFKAAANRYDLPWTLIAAIAFQESHWNNDAVSYTGVKGIMMLTKTTAKHLEIKDRRNLRESVFGGAKYIHQLIARQPKHLPKRARIALALAAYNVGPGHLQDAIGLARQNGRDPYKWTDLKATLPQLSQASVAKNLKFGMARGHEPVKFVDRVFSYYDLMSATL